MKKKMKPKKKQGLTTGEVSKMLHGRISLTTVSRYFDKGILSGWKNPITGKRLIDPDTVKPLTKKAKETQTEPSEGMASWPQRGRPRKTTLRPSSGR